MNYDIVSFLEFNGRQMPVLYIMLLQGKGLKQKKGHVLCLSFRAAKEAKKAKQAAKKPAAPAAKVKF